MSWISRIAASVALMLAIAGSVVALRLAFDPLPRAPMGFAGFKNFARLLEELGA